MKGFKSAVSGIAGATVLTGMHQLFRNRVDSAPRIDKLGMQTIKKLFGKAAPQKKKLYNTTLASDLAFNSLYYSVSGFSRKPVLTGSLLGLASGLGVVFIPRLIGLDNRYSALTTKTAFMSFVYYLAGGIVSGALAKGLKK